MDEIMANIIEGMKVLVEWLIVLALLAPIGWGAFKICKLLLKPLKQLYEWIANGIMALEKRLVDGAIESTTYRKTLHEKTKINPNTFKPQEANNTQQKPQKPIEPESIDADEYKYFDTGYQAKYLLTRNEWYEFRKLRELTSSMGLVICPKVRLLDIIEPRRGEPDYMSLLGRIKSKHVDFVICDPDLRVKAILELDDNSHNRRDRQERDEFVDTVLQSVGYTVIHTRGITEHTLDVLKPKADPAGEQGRTST